MSSRGPGSTTHRNSSVGRYYPSTRSRFGSQGKITGADQFQNRRDLLEEMHKETLESTNE